MRWLASSKKNKMWRRLEEVGAIQAAVRSLATIAFPSGWDE